MNLLMGYNKPIIYVTYICGTYVRTCIVIMLNKTAKLIVNHILAHNCHCKYMYVHNIVTYIHTRMNT